MKIVAVISQKGGAGKTTLAVNLAVAAELKNAATVLIDLDPQASAKTWHDIRERKDAPFVVSSRASRLEEVLEISRSNGAELVVIDTAPHSESTALAAAGRLTWCSSPAVRRSSTSRRSASPRISRRSPRSPPPWC